MARWFGKAIAAGVGKSKVDNESSRATWKANEAKRQFYYAKREKNIDKKIAYMAEGMSCLAEAVDHVSNTTVPIANVAFASSLLAKDLESALKEQTQDIIKQLNS
ncbi:MAG: hypothetical protein VW946_05845 [Gammaproteobacteria bacterium]